MAVLTLGVEEELQVVDARTGELLSRADDVLTELTGRTTGAAQIVGELPMSQVEAVTGVHTTLDGLRAELSAARRDIAGAAERAGLRVLCAGTPPICDMSRQQNRTEGRYAAIVDQMAYLAREQFIAGTHVHVGLPDDESRVAATDMMRLWVPTLVALGANSPYWLGQDSGFASFRAAHWWRLPITGPPPYAGSKVGYDSAVDSLLKSGIITDPSRLYWDVRLALSYPTVETRAMDAMTSLDDLLVLVGLIRGLVTASLGATDLGWRAPPVRGEVLRAASWYAARYGLADDLIDVFGPRHASVRSVVDMALRVARPHLEEAGDYDFVKDGLDRMVADGGGAARQRRAYERGGLWAVVDDLTDGFLEGTGA